MTDNTHKADYLSFLIHTLMRKKPIVLLQSNLQDY